MSDDGEPAHTAGKPVMSVISNSNITNIIITVVRFFGGVKLGTGGLVKAYTESAKAAIDGLQLIEIRETDVYDIEIDYRLYDVVRRFLLAENAEISDEVFTDKVVMRIELEKEKADEVFFQLNDITNSNIIISRVFS